jgi:hypothetical protein
MVTDVAILLAIGAGLAVLVWHLFERWVRG